LALAALRAAGLDAPAPLVSSLARKSSASAARSVFGGFVELALGADSAEPVATADHFDLRLVVGVVTQAAKEVGSTRGMISTQGTSPYYPSWVETAPGLFREIREAVQVRDFERLGTAMEHSTLLMHCTMMTALPALLYWRAESIELMHAVRGLRREGIPAYFTADAGPHVKVLTLPEHAAAVEARLESVPGVQNTIVTGLGPGARVEAE
jgi:diphosphomevalonate decarboxylase